MALSRYGKADKIYDDGTGLLSAIVRRFKVDGQYTTVAQLPTAVFLAYETADEEHDDCLLAHQDVKSREGADPQESILTRVYVQIPADAATLVQIGNDLVTYSENGLKMVEQRFFGKRTHSLAGTVGTTTGASGDINTLILTSNGFAERGKVSAVVVKRWAEAGILSVRTPLVGGQQTVSVSAIGMTEAAVTTALASVTTTHVLINQTVGSYLGFQTKEFTYEVDDFVVRSQSADGMQIIARTELATADFSDGVVGTDTYNDDTTHYLIGEQIDNGNTIKKRTSRYSEAGLLSIRPVRDNAFSLAPSYIYVTTGAPASSMTGLIKPDGNALGTAVTWFEPEVQNVLGFPTYTQLVIAKTLTETEVKVHSTEGFFVITDPGIMSTGGAFHSAAKSGGAVRYPQATTQPRTYRRKATVDVYLTSLATISEVEVAYSEKNVNWCSIAFDSFSLNEKEASASVSANWRNFSKFLNSPGTTGTSYATTLGEYFAEARSYGAGDTTYVTDGIYRVIPKPYMRDKDGNQLYLKTVITF